MSEKDKNSILEEDILEEMKNDIEQIEDDKEEVSEELQEEANEDKNDKTKEILAKTLADFDNYKKRMQRDREDMIFFLKSDILKSILPRLDDLERIIKNTPEDLKQNPLYEWLISMEKKLLDDLEKMWVKSFNSIWSEVNPDKHDVMTVVPWKETWIIFDEFEKWYTLDWKILRHAKVIVWA